MPSSTATVRGPRRRAVTAVSAPSADADVARSDPGERVAGERTDAVAGLSPHDRGETAR